MAGDGEFPAAIVALTLVIGSYVTRVRAARA